VDSTSEPASVCGFPSIPQAGEFGVDTWLKDSWSYTDNTGVWGQVSVDEQLSLVYLPVDLQTGKRKWHYQLVHHGIWDMDIPCAPILADIVVDGRAVKVAAQPTKQSYLYVFDRTTGQPIWPIEEKPVPPGDMPGEWYAPTQPIPTKPPPYDNQGVSIESLIDFTPELRAEAEKLVSHYRIGPLFRPPSLIKVDGTLGTISVPGSLGGANWPGGSYDADSHTMYLFSQSAPTTLGLVQPPDPKVSDMNYIIGIPGAAPKCAKSATLRRFNVVREEPPRP